MQKPQAVQFGQQMRPGDIVQKKVTSLSRVED